MPAEIVNQLAGLALYPWQNFTWLGLGHSCQFSTAAGDIGVLLSDSQATEITGSKSAKLPNFRGDAVNLLWLRAISQSDYEKISSGELTLDELVRRGKASDS